ncbi:hypothetical protein F5148DRAFT_1369803 [Russula earlei]|uniref:Uncharacterized protein n=1 Tax=Russula earlei TaxID=71964 RepID=A0ACC0U1J4_9AGAM|nr:hypothetical protein F5148DRAFT_1369803 [Russula earlei]
MSVVHASSQLHIVISASPIPHYSVTSSSHYCLTPPAPPLHFVVPSQASLEASSCEHRQDINTLPDDVLVEICHFYANLWRIGTNGWHTLVHVCQRQRHVVFASPRRLNMRLVYTGKRPMSEMLYIWPVLPVVIDHRSVLSNSWGNVAGALESEHRHRCQIDLWDIPTSQWERFAAAMQKLFPELTDLQFRGEDNTVTPLPDSFLGASAPLLRYLLLNDCPFQGLPKLLLSANQLVISALFEQSRVHEYFEDLLAQIEVPLLNTLEIRFFMVPDFVLPQLHRLISHRIVRDMRQSNYRPQRVGFAPCIAGPGLQLILSPPLQYYNSRSRMMFLNHTGKMT